jgi:cell division protein FtsQ
MNYAPPLSAQAANATLPFDIRAMRFAANVLVFGVLAALAVIAVQWAANRGTFTISRLRVAGDFVHANPISVRAHAVGRLQGTFFTLDLLRAKAVFEQVPWVRRATVRRVWPNGLLVELSEHKAVALWGDESQEKLVNQQGEVFDANPDEIQVELPRLIGPTGSAARMLTFHDRLNAKLEPRSARVVNLTLSNRQEWSADLDDGMQLLLGRDDGELWERFDRYAATAEQARSRLGQMAAVLGQPWARVDLRHNMGYAIALATETTMQNARERQSNLNSGDAIETIVKHETIRSAPN